MAISAPHFYCFRELHRRGELPQGGALLEIGEANWYGDIAPPEEIATDLKQFLWQAESRELLPFHTVKAIYRWLLKCKKIDSIDFDGPTSEKRDLNTAEVSKACNYDVVINHGTAEHIFNVANVFRLMHDQCKSGGLMIHESPFTGWIDHGFWTVQPTAYYDLAHANSYDMRFMAVNQIKQQSSVEIHSREQLIKMAAAGGIPNNAMIYVAMRKTVDEPFQIPMQGVYGSGVSTQVLEAWQGLR